MTGDADLVARVKQALISEQQIPVQQSTHEHALLITAHVAAATGGRLVVKASGDGAVVNGVRYSSDGINFDDGYVDCLTDAGPPKNGNGPTWQVKAHAANFDRSQLTDPRTAPQPVIRALTPAAPIDPPDEPDEPEAPTQTKIPLPELIAILQAAMTTAVAKQFDVIGLELADIKADLAEIHAVQARGLQIPYLGIAKPAPEKKANGQP